MPQPRKSNRLRLLTGQPARTPPPSTPPLDTDPPLWLPREAKTEWRRIMAYVNASHLGHIQTLDRPGLIAYVMCWATWVEAAKDVSKRGTLVPGRSSADAARACEDDEPVLVKNPAVQILRDAGIQLRYWCREFGFTPDSRGRMDLPGPPDQDDVSSLLS